MNPRRVIEFSVRSLVPLSLLASKNLSLEVLDPSSTSTFVEVLAFVVTYGMVLVILVSGDAWILVLCICFFTG